MTHTVVKVAKKSAWICVSPCCRMVTAKELWEPLGQPSQVRSEAGPLPKGYLSHPAKGHLCQRRATELENSMRSTKVTGESSVWQSWYLLPRSTASINTNVKSETEKAESEVWESIVWNSCLQTQAKQYLCDCVYTHTDTYIYGPSWSRGAVLCYTACYIANRKHFGLSFRISKLC